MSDPGRIFRAAYHPARPYLLHRGLLGLFAFDVWLGMLEHAARYGMGGFNVAHFAWVDALVPEVSPGLYGGLLVLAGILALVMALAGGTRFGKALLAFAFTSSWLISLHDSYQHHYLLSWLLAWLVFMPDPAPEEAQSRDGPLVRGVGLPLTALTCAIVYTFTGISKSEPEWRSGAVLRRLSRSKEPGAEDPGALDPIRDVLLGLGLDMDTAWRCIAVSVILLQATVAIGYVASVRRDEAPSRVRNVLAWLALLGAWSFHGMAELGDMFDIGWFSYYMLLVSFALLAPARAVSAVARAVAFPKERVVRALRKAGRVRLLHEFGTSVGGAVAVFALNTLALSAIGAFVDVPGVLWAALCGLAWALGWAVLRIRAGDSQAAVRVGLSTLCAAFALWYSLTQTSVRFDYYRRAAGELARMERLEEALENYRKAEAYAPPGKSRRAKIEELEAQLRARKRGER